MHSSILPIAVAGLLSALVCLPSTSNAELILYEGFDYPLSTSVAGESGGTGEWTGTWGSDTGSTVAGLTYPGLQTSGNALAAFSSTSNTRSWDATGVGGEGTSTWFSGLVSVTAANSGQNRFLFSEQSSGNGFGFEASAGDTGFTVTARAEGTNGALSSSEVAIGDTALVIGRVDWGATDDLVSIWVNPADFSSAVSLGTATSSATATGGLTNFAAFYPRNGSFQGPSTVTYDEIRLGETLADVTPIPEPGAGLLLLAGLALGLTRRRRARS